MTVLGKLAVIGAACSYAVNVVLVRSRARAEPLTCAAGTLVISSAATLPLALAGGPALAGGFTMGSAVAVLLLGVFSTAVGSVLYFRVVRRAGASFLSTINYLIPVWAVAIGVLALGEAPAPRALAGLVLVLAGVAVSQWAPARPPRALPARGWLESALASVRTTTWGPRPIPVARPMRPSAGAKGRGRPSI